jgi:FtsZ-binding cell division protein ZapB
MPVAVADAVTRALDKKPDRRFATCREFAQTLAAGRETELAEEAAATPSTARADAKQSSVIEVRCPNPGCGKILHLRPEHAGRKARCKACDTRVYIGEDLSVSASPRDTTPKSAAKADTLVMHPALSSGTISQHDLGGTADELRSSLIRLVFEDTEAKLPDIQLIREMRRRSDQLRAEIDELKEKTQRLEQEQAEFSGIAEELARRKKVLDEAMEQLKALYQPLGESAYQGLISGNLKHQPLFVKRKTCGDKLNSLREEYERLGEAKGLFDKAKAKAKQAVIWSQIRLEESNAKSLSSKIGQELVETESEHIVECPETGEVLAQVADARQAAEKASAAADEARSNLDGKRVAIQTVFGLKDIQYPKQLQKEIVRCRKLIDVNQAELSDVRHSFPDRLIEASENLELDRSTIFGRILLDLREIVARQRELQEG